jgi:hypothetical protein
VIGHPADPLHPFSDADMVARELPNARFIDANSILEWRISPSRLDGELAAFLDDVWEAPKKPKRKTSGASKRKASTGSKRKASTGSKRKSAGNSKPTGSGNSKPKASARPRRSSGSASR